MSISKSLADRIKKLNESLTAPPEDGRWGYALTGFAHDPENGQLVLFIYPDENGRITEGGLSGVEAQSITKHLEATYPHCLVVCSDYSGDLGYIYSNRDYEFTRLVTADGFAFHVKSNPRAPLEYLGYWSSTDKPLDLPQPTSPLPPASQFCKECQLRSMSVAYEGCEYRAHLVKSYNPGPHDRIWCYQLRQTVQLTDSIPDKTCPFTLEILYADSEGEKTL